MIAGQTVRSPHTARQKWVACLALLGTGAVLFLFDPAKYSFYPTCPFFHWTGLLCPGCGSLRALHEMAHGNLPAAFHFNPLLCLSLPFLAWLGLAQLSSSHRRISPDARRVVWRWSITGLLLFGLLRNLPVPPFTSLRL